MATVQSHIEGLSLSALVRRLISYHPGIVKRIDEIVPNAGWVVI